MTVGWDGTVYNTDGDVAEAGEASRAGMGGSLLVGGLVHL